jgi:hypothetical protein
VLECGSGAQVSVEFDHGEGDEPAESSKWDPWNVMLSMSEASAFRRWHKSRSFGVVSG